MNNELTGFKKVLRFLITTVLMIPVFFIVVVAGAEKVPVEIAIPLALMLVAGIHYGTGWLLFRMGSTQTE